MKGAVEREGEAGEREKEVPRWGWEERKRILTLPQSKNSYRSPVSS